MNIRKICFLAGEYPTVERPKSAVFYQHLVHQFAKMGLECRVIHPQALNHNGNVTKRLCLDTVDDVNQVKVYRPYSITAGAKKIGPWNTAYASAYFYTRSATKALKEMDWSPDIFYGHFVSPAGVMAALLSRQTGIPAFISYGESRPWSIETIGMKRCQDVLNSIAGFIAVSTKNRNDLIDMQIASEDNVKVFPNGVNRTFYKRDKWESRKKLGWDPHQFIVAFVGHFDNRKGVLRLDEAVRDIPDVHVAYAGSGSLKPQAINTMYAGNITPEMMPTFLSAADIFVLPTLNEGSCNAIIEAMACGLPVVSSDRAFNYDILTKDNAILIDPENVSEIRTAILKLKSDSTLKTSLEIKSLVTAQKLTIEERATNILEWMERKVLDFNKLNLGVNSREAK